MSEVRERWVIDWLRERATQAFKLEEIFEERNRLASVALLSAADDLEEILFPKKDDE